MKKIFLVFLFIFLQITVKGQIIPFIGYFNSMPVYKLTPSFEADPAGFLELTDSVTILDVAKNDYFKVKLSNGTIVYIGSNFFVHDKSFAEVDKVAKAINADLDRKADIKQKASFIKIFGQTYGLAVYNKQISIGMTKGMVKTSWGEPQKVNRTVGSWGVHEQWIYNDSYLYFENGKLTSWQD